MNLKHSLNEKFDLSIKKLKIFRGSHGLQIVKAPTLEQGPPHTPNLQPSRDAKQAFLPS